MCYDSLVPGLNYVGNKIRGKFHDQRLKQNKITFTYGKTLNIHIAYEINLWDREYDDYSTLENSLFCAVKLVKNANIDK